MNYLLDTCVISELIKKHPDSKVVQWISSVEEIQLFISVLTIGELYRGIEKLPEGKKRNDLHWWVSFDLKKRFQHKIINFDLKTAAIWGKIQAKAERSGQKLPVMDSLIAATGISHDLVVVTRNIKDMENSGVELLNPWD
ncbi:type II toxin-antitoxin system VapC family toxin [Desulfobotulus mexicanus]|uniref:Type II toxin-antitoxin system VapC family toxin n=1 Tax=Desulfobotulus mexicanus TaxID=2586642 RepID=A0A5Q4VEE9_9BACT|nr:type II toxin-antitoxin system VapC family toxin [Desulfobotulus mexicanus]TYT76064.1 type II toxin-antitoxin system VapC family toxin [Desulfobotulus mexicanus]